MSRVTSKFQVSIPRELARSLAIQPGDDLIWESAGDSLNVRPRRAAAAPALSIAARLRLFDETTARIEERLRQRAAGPRESDGRGWTREDLYEGRLGKW